MKAITKANKRNALFIVAMSVALLASSVSAFAVPANQVTRKLVINTFKAQCCVLLGSTVTLVEPATVQPVILTWSTDFAVDGTALFGLSVNGGSCALYGSGVAPSVASGPGTTSAFVSGSFQWVVFPSDGLVKGTNTFSVCGGGANSSVVNLVLGSRTLTVQISK